MAELELRGVVKRFGGEEALRGLSFRLERGAAIALEGPSGCGKTTALRIIAGFTAPDSGAIAIRGEDAAGPSAMPPRVRAIGMVFQHGALWPHMTAEGHLRFVLKGCSMARRQRRLRVDELLESCRLAHRRKARPATLSGGERQRLSIARALAQRPRILLLDEPFTNLDPALCAHFAETLRLCRERDGTAIVLSAHEPGWAAAVADRTVRMNAHPYRTEASTPKAPGVEPGGGAC